MTGIRTYKSASFKNSHRLLSPFSLYLLLGLFLISGCGGGGESPPPPAKVAISGAILVPGGKDSTSNPTGLEGAANKSVKLYKINNNGDIIGNALDSATSDINGNYVLLLPADIPFSSDIIVEADLGNNEIARAIVIDASTDITPITEYITAKIIDDPTLSLDSLPLSEITDLIAFVESLPLGPEPNLSAMLIQIASYSDQAIEAQIDDLINQPPQIRLSGLLAVPAPVAPKSSLHLLRPIPNTTVNLFRIDNNGNAIGAALATATTNDKGVFTLQLPAGESLSSSLVLRASVGSDVISALVISKELNVDSTSQYVFSQITDEPDLVLNDLPVGDVLSLIEYVKTLNIAEASDLASTLSLIDSQAGAEINAQINSIKITIASSPGVWGSSNWSTSAFQ